MSANPFDFIGADIDVSDGSLALIVSNQEVGEWPLHSVEIESAIDGFHVRVDGEEFIFSTREADAFASAVGVSLFGSRRQKPGRSSQVVTAIKTSALVQPPASSPAPAPTRVPARSKVSTAAQARAPAPASKPVQVKPKRARQPVSAGAARRVRSVFFRKDIFGAGRLIGMGLVIGVVALAIIARPLLAGILLLVGMTGVLLGGAAAVDPLLATRLPESWSASRLSILGAAMLALGVILVAI